MSINHTLSVPTFLQSTIDPLLQQQSFPCDRQICSTRASANSLQALVDYHHEKLRSLGQSEASYRGKIEVIPIPTDTGRFIPGDRCQARRSLGIAKDDFVLLYVGYISLAKADLTLYLEPLRVLASRYKARRVLWCIAGTGEAWYIAFIRRRVRELGLDRYVRLETDISAVDKVLFYQAADVFVSPSDTVQESFGMTVVEAMACGIPQVVSDWNGYRELVVQGETGFLVRTLWADCTDEFRMPFEMERWGRDHVGLGQSVSVDLEGWFKSIEILYMREDLRRAMGEASRKRAVERYANSVVAGLHRELWREMELECATDRAPIRYRQELSTPDYFRCFQHYASELIDNTSLLRRTQRGEDTVMRAMDAYRTLPTMDSLLHPDLISTLLVELDEESSMGEVCGRASRVTGVSDSTLRRHLMWLIKQNFLQVIRPDSA